MKPRFRFATLAILAAALCGPLLAADTEKDHRKLKLDPQAQALLEKLTASGSVAGIITPEDVDQARAAYRSLIPLAGTPEPVLRVVDRQIPGPGGPLPIRIYTPSNGNTLPVVVYFHGGIFTTGSIETHDTLLRALANRSGAIIVSVGYRLAPDYPFPAAPEDAYAATKWVSEHAAEFHADPARLAVAGDGAGGNLAAVAAQMARDRGGPEVRYQVLVYPYTSVSMLTVSWWDFGNGPVLSRKGMLYHLAKYTTVTSDFGNPYLSPLSAENFKGLPPALIITAEYDPTRDEAEQYAHELNDEGVHAHLSRYPGMVHGFLQMTGELDAAKKCLDEMAEAIRVVLGS